MHGLKITPDGMEEICAAVAFHTRCELDATQTRELVRRIEARWRRGRPVEFEIEAERTLNGKPAVVELGRAGYVIERPRRNSRFKRRY